MSDDKKIKSKAHFEQKKESTFDKYFAHVGEKEIEQTEDAERQNSSSNNDPVSSERSMSQTADSIMFKNDKQVTLLPYSYLTRSDLTEKDGIKLKYIGTDVTIKGKNLFPLLEAINRKKAYFVQLNNPKYENEENNKIWIDEIIISDAN